MCSVFCSAHAEGTAELRAEGGELAGCHPADAVILCDREGSRMIERADKEEGEASVHQNTMNDNDNDIIDRRFRTTDNGV